MTDMPRSDSRPADAADDDQHWLDLVAGRAVDDAHGATRREAAWLRAALLSYRTEAPAGAPSPAGPRADRLVARARTAGVLPPQAVALTPPASAAAPSASPSPAPAQPITLPQRAPQASKTPIELARQGRHRSTRPAWTWALAASLAGLTLFGTLRWAGLPGLGDPPEARGDGASPTDTLRGAARQLRRSTQPLADRDRLLQQLRGAGFDAQPYERLGRPGIDLALPVPLADAQREALARLQIAAPPGPGLQIEFVAGAAGATSQR